MPSAELSFVPEYPEMNGGQGIPPRSRLFAMEPIGVGTPAVEGLISYIIRLANAYSVSPRRLIMEEFVKSSPEIARYKRRGLFFETDARSINGLHKHSLVYSEIVARLCGLSAASLMTLLPLKALLPFNGTGLIASHIRWCPACYAGMLESGQELYQPLAWSFDLYRTCHRHGEPMVDRCPSCNEHQYVIPRSPTIGFCSCCGIWLGIRSGDAPPMKDVDAWLGHAISEIVSQQSRLEEFATRDRFVSQLNLAIDHYTDGNRRRFCREIGVPENAFQYWLSGDHRPTLPQWLAIAYGLNLCPVEFLTATFMPSSELPTLRKLPVKFKPRVKRPFLTKERRDQIEEELKMVVATGNGEMSVTMFAEEHQLTRSHLRHLWPELCGRITRDFMEAMKSVAKGKSQRQCAVVKKTVDDFLARGVYPSQREMRRALDSVGLSLANPAIREAYMHRLMQMLDGLGVFRP